MSDDDPRLPNTRGSDPAAIELRLDEIDGRLAHLQNDLEDAAMEWFTAKREREKAWAEAFVGVDPIDEDTKKPVSVAKREALATEASCEIGMEAEARYEGMRAVARTLETRASIGMALLKSQGRA